MAENKEKKITEKKDTKDRKDKKDKKNKKDRNSRNNKGNKNGRPSNLLLALLIFGSLILIFGGVFLYNYMQKPANVQKYMKQMGGAKAFSSVQVNDTATASITAKKNDMTVTVKDTSEDVEKQTKYYKSKKGEEEIKFLSAYYLYYFKSATRGFTASVTSEIYVGDKKVNTVKQSFREAKKLLKEKGAVE